MRQTVPGTHPASARGSISAALWLLAVAAPSVARAQDALPEGVVLVVGEVDAGVALAAAREAGGARWRVERVTPRAPEPAAPPAAEVEALRRHYLDADFLRCLATLQEPALSMEALLEAGHRDEAARVGVFGAGCAFGAGDTDLAERLLERLFVAGLDPAAPLAVTTPDLQALAEGVRQRVLARERVTVEVRTRPDRAEASADGGGDRCAPTPCPLTVVRGRHLLTVTRLGFAPRTLTGELQSDGAVSVALDPAAAPAVRAQLAAALHADLGPGDAPFARAAADAFEARVVCAVWTSGARTHALVFDRPRDRVVSRVAASGAGGTRTVVRSAVEEWRGLTEPTPLLEQPLFWIVTAGVAVAAGLAVYFAVRPDERRYDLVFQR